MKYSQQFFKFPVKLYKGVDWRKIEKQMELEIDSELVEPPFAKGWEYCNPELITNISPYFSAFVSIEDIQENGPKLSLIHFQNGKEFVCYWSCETFLKKLDAFMDEIIQKEIEMEETRLERIKTMLEDKLGEIKSEYEKLGITLKLEE